MNSILENYLIGKSSGGDFNTAYNSATSIACTNLPTYHNTLTNNDILSIVQINNVGKVIVHSSETWRIVLNLNIILFSGVEFADSDTFLIYTNIARLPLCDRNIPPMAIVSNADIGAVDGVWIDQGAELDVTEPFIIGIWWDLKVNNSTGNELRMLCSHTSGGGLYKMAKDAEYIIELGNADDSRISPFSIGDLYPYIQFQSRATSLGLVEGKISIDITRGWTLEW